MTVGAFVVATSACQTDATLGDPGNSGGGLSLDVLSAFFVETFDAYREEAERLRETDPRYVYQDNVWRPFRGSDMVYDSYPLASSRAEYAHAAGLSGRDTIVSVVDAGFLASHEVFDGKTLYFAPGGIPVDPHGTGVASVVAGNSATMVGVAPGADLAFGVYTSPATLALAAREALRLGAVAQNNSWGYALDISPSSFGIVFRGSGADYLAALDAYAAEGVVVFAVSNDASRTTSTIMDALPSLRPSLEPGWLAVADAVPVFDDDRIISAELVSSGCHQAARWCLVADGAWMQASADSDISYRFATGSSFATPQVSGALALLAEAFPDLTPHDLRIRLLASADNGFFAHDDLQELAPGFFKGYSTEFGHGFLDIRAALLPIGPTLLPTPSGRARKADAPVLVAGAAVGDAVARGLSRQSVLVTDSLGADFRMGGEALVAGRAPEPLLAARLGRLSAESLAADRRDGGPDGAHLFSAMAAPRLTLASPDRDLLVDILFPGEGDLGIGVTRALGDADGISLGMSLLRDGSGRLGLAPVADGPGVWAAALDLKAETAISATGTFAIFGQAGVMTASAAPGFAEIAPTRFASLGIDLSRRDAVRAGDRLGISVEMPTAVTSGSAVMVLPVARSADGVSFEALSIDMAPEDREMRLSLSYQTPLGRGWEVIAEGVHVVNRGNRAGATDTGALFSVQRRF